MSTLPPEFSMFKMSEDQQSLMKKDFEFVLANVDFSRTEQFERVVAHRKQASGIYFWVMRHNESESLFRIYIGKTKSLSSRLQNYFGEFQPHSTNDFKLRVFQSYMSTVAPSAALDLIFSPKREEQLVRAENEAIKIFDPLLNRRQLATADSRAALQNAFSVFYRSALDGLLKSAS